MKKMIASQKTFYKQLQVRRYNNGQLAVFIHNKSGEPLAELSIMDSSVELHPNEFILKDYSENENIAQEFIDHKLIIPTNRYVLIGTHFCPICKTKS